MSAPGRGGALLALALTACGSSPRPASRPAEQTRRALVEQTASCIGARIARAHEAIEALARTAQAAVDDGGVDALQSARRAWRDAIDAWQLLELHQVGPLARADRPGGRDLRDEIYSWPLSSRCLVDQTIVSGAFDGDGLAAALVSARGLDAVEYLLFHEGSDNGCPPTNVINSSGSWAALGEEERSIRRRRYAASAARLVAMQSARLVEAWGDGARGHHAALVTAGAEGSPYASVAAAVNDLSDALFYVETVLRDAKVGRPLGIWECTLPDCTVLAEAPYARAGLRMIRANLRALGLAITGCAERPDAVGFEDLLRDVGAGGLADRLVAAHAAAMAAADAITGEDLAEAIRGDRAAVLALHERLKAITDLLKLEVVVVLGLELPPTVAGDND
ncbi:MAG: imelysin family protein [Myxococcales bacterium]|nr:imelysin family protein [Myxococcales bacterium]